MASNSYGWMKPDTPNPFSGNSQQMDRQVAGGFVAGSSAQQQAAASRLGMNNNDSRLQGFNQVGQGANLYGGEGGVSRTGSGLNPASYGPAYTGGLQDTYGVYGGDVGPNGQPKQQPQYGTNSPSPSGGSNQYPTAPAWNYQPSSNTNPYDPGKIGFNPYDASKYGDENFRNMMEGYSNYFAIPQGNLDLARRTQGFNEQQAYQNYLEQQRVNSGQMDLAYRGSSREDQALAFGQQNNTRDFGEAQRQFNQQQNLAAGQAQVDAKYKSGLISAQEYQNQTGRLQAQNEFALGQQQNTNNAQKNQWDYSLGMGANANQQQANANTLSLGKAANATNMALGMGQNPNAATKNQNDLLLGQGANANSRYGIDVQQRLG
jgi:hypothetical protein